MKPYQANLINAAILIGLGLWGYFTGSGSPTALIAPAVGVVLLAMHPWMKKENKAIAHVVVLLTLLLLIALFMPLKSALGKEEVNSLAVMRTGVMILSCLTALMVFIKSFRDARKARS